MANNHVVGKLKAKESRGRNHFTYRIWNDSGIYPAQTYISHGIRDINDPLIGIMARQLSITHRLFVALILCELGRADHLKLANYNPADKPE